jgi:hypothetical protein
MTITLHLSAAVKMEVILQPEQQPGQPGQQPEQSQWLEASPVQIKQQQQPSNDQQQATIHINTPGKKYTVKC